MIRFAENIVNYTAKCWNLIQYTYCESKVDKEIRICSDGVSAEVLSEAATDGGLQ